MHIFNLVASSIITSISFLVCVKIFSKEKSSIINMILFVLFSSLEIFLVNYFLSTSILKIFINVFALIILFYLFIFNRNINKSIYYSFILFLFSTIVEILCSLVLNEIFNFNLSQYKKNELSLLFFSLINSIVLILFCLINRVKKQVREYENNRKINITFIVFTLFILSLFIFRNYVILNNNKASMLINSLIFIFTIVLIFIIINMNYKKEKLEEKYNEMIDYVSEYEKIIDEQGQKNHEFNNQLMIIYGYLNDKKKLKEYLQTIVDEHRTGDNFEIRQLSHFPNGGLKGLIYFKLSKMKEYKIKNYLYISNDIKNEFENLDLKTYQDITKIFGVFLDNAIEAAKDADKKEIELDISKDERYINVKISNTFNKNNNINKVGSKGFTTKGKGHGYGLSLVKNIVKRNNKLETLTNINKDYFEQTLIIDTK